MSSVVRKCGYYSDLGIAKIYVFDPVERWAARWDNGTRKLQRIGELKLTNGSILQVPDIFLRFDERLNRRK